MSRIISRSSMSNSARVAAALSTLVIALLAVGGTVLNPHGALAQPPYPSVPPAAVTGSVDQTAPAAGSSVTVTCTVRDAQGRPLEGQTCTFAIISQPGADAAIAPTSALTDAQGRATAVLFCGSVPGVIVLRVEAGGIVSQVTVNPQAVPTLPGATPVELPPTGAGSKGAGGWPLAPWIIALSIVTGMALVGYAIWRARLGRVRPR